MSAWKNSDRAKTLALVSVLHTVRNMVPMSPRLSNTPVDTCEPRLASEVARDVAVAAARPAENVLPFVMVILLLVATMLDVCEHVVLFPAPEPRFVSF